MTRPVVRWTLPDPIYMAKFWQDGLETNSKFLDFHRMIRISPKSSKDGAGAGAGADADGKCRS